MKRLLLPLIPLVALLVAACGGSSADIPALATVAADATPASSFDVVAKNTKFDTDTLVVAADQEVTITLDNQDSALHNLSVYTEKGGDVIYQGELFTGKDTREYSFEAPDPGVYYFRCDAHPEMEGVFIVK